MDCSIIQWPEAQSVCQFRLRHPRALLLRFFGNGHGNGNGHGHVPLDEWWPKKGCTSPNGQLHLKVKSNEVSV